MCKSTDADGERTGQGNEDYEGIRVYIKLVKRLVNYATSKKNLIVKITTFPHHDTHKHIG